MAQRWILLPIIDKAIVLDCDVDGPAIPFPNQPSAGFEGHLPLKVEFARAIELFSETFEMP
jgi:hypothetical protein